MSLQELKTQFISRVEKVEDVDVMNKLVALAEEVLDGVYSNEHQLSEEDWASVARGQAQAELGQVITLEQLKERLSATIGAIAEKKV